MALWKRPWAAALAALIFIAFDLRTEERPPSLTLEQCVALSLAQNPLWLSAEGNYQASLARVRQAREFPQPSLAIDSDLQPSLFNFRRSGESYFGINQAVEFPVRRALRGRIASLESREVLADNEKLRQEIIFQVKEAFFGVLLAEERRKYAVQDLDLARDFLEKAQAKYEAGDIARLEVVRARVEASKAATAVKLADNEVVLAKARLNYLLGRSELEPLEIRGDFTRSPLLLDRELLLARALRSRPEIARMEASLQKEERRRTEAWMGYLPDFTLGVSRHRLAGEPRTWDVTLSIPIPLFFWQPARGRVAEARANILALERLKADMVNRISLEVGEALQNSRTAAEQTELIGKDILPQAEEAYELILFSFQEGEISGFELIDARRSLLEARKAYADALFNYSLTLAALEKSIGGSLEGGGHE